MLEKNFNADIYLRLSREDGDKEESDSIVNQKMLILNFLKDKKNIKLHKIRIDDGYSGVNFDRPAFIEMIEDVKAGKVDCIIVKDLSRFGRNYIEIGKYITNIFPFLNVRFIAINDNFDTGSGLNSSEMTVFHFKNILNNAYCGDISVKVRSQLDIKRKNGDFIGSYAPYGYLKSPDNNNMLIVDDMAAEVVKKIFGLKISGMSASRIANRLNDEGIASPMEHKRELGIKFGTGFAKSVKPKWNAKTVARILQNKVYIGTLEQGKRTTPNYRIKKTVFRPYEEWFIVENNHEAIIDRDTFYCVQNLLKEDTRVSPVNNEVYIFSGIVKCGKCGGNLTIHSLPSRKKDKYYYYYICLTHKNKKGCGSKLHFSVDKFEKTVLAAVNSHIKNFVKVRKLANYVSDISFKASEIFRIEKEIEKTETEIKIAENDFIELYKDFKEKLIDEKGYKILKDSYAAEEEKLRKRLAELNERHKQFSTDSDLFSIYNDFTQESEIKELTRELVISLIDKIYIYDNENIEIKFKYQLEYDMMLKKVRQSNIYEEVL